MHSCAGSFATELIDVDVNEQAKPECLQKVENSALFSVQEAKADDVSISEVKERANVKGQFGPKELQ